MVERDITGWPVTDMEQESALKMLEFTATNFPKSQEAMYLKIGKWFSKEPLSASEREDLGFKLAYVHAFKVGECYMNAGKLAMERDGLIFCEGFAAGLWPVAHAWVSYKDRAIDVTWPQNWGKPYFKATARAEDIMRRVEHNLKHCSYFGVEIPTEAARLHFIKQKRWSPLFDPRFARDWPKFTELLTSRNVPATMSIQTQEK